MCGLAIDTLWERKDLIVTTATITFIGRPDGLVFFEYVDKEGVLHSEDDPTDNPSYRDGRYMGHSGDISSLIGKTVKIAYNPVSGRIDIDHHLMCYCHIFSYILSVILLCLYWKMKFINQKVLIPKQNSTDIRIFYLKLLTARLLHRHRNCLKATKNQTSEQATEERFIVTVD